MADQQGPTSQPQGQPQPQPPQQPLAPYYDYRDDEISLYELWNTLVRRRLLIGAVFVLALAAATVFALSRTPTYQFDAVIEVGQIPSLSEENPMGRIESPAGLASRLNEIIIPRVISELSTDEVTPPAPEASVLNNDAGLLRLSLTIPAEAAEPMAPVMRAIIDATVALHDQRIAQQREQIVTQLKALRDELAGLIAERNRVMSSARNQEFADGSTDVDARLAGMMEGMVEALVTQNIATDQVRLREAIASLEARSAVFQPTAMVRPPSMADSPEGQPASTIIALGAVLGLMLGVFAAFGREFLENAAAEQA